MANDDENRLWLTLEARLTDLEKGMKKADQITSGSFNKMRKNSRSATQMMEQDALRSSRAIRQAWATTSTQVGDYSRSFANQLGPVGAGMSALGPAGLVAAGGIGAMVLGLTSGISSAAEAERVFRRLDAVLKLAGGAAGLTAGQINDYANELQRSTGIAVNEINSAAAALATYSNISGDRFKEVIRLSSDMVAVYGGNLREWSDKIARAIDDPIQGFAALKRSGFQLTDAQLDLVESMRKVGDVAGYQNEMIKILSDSLGGAAGEQNKGMAGSFTRAKNAAVGFLEAMAQWGVIKRPVEATLNAISSGLEHLADKAERMRKIEVDVGINVVQLTKDLDWFENRLKKMEETRAKNPSSIAPDQIEAVRKERDRIAAEIEKTIQRGHEEVAELVNVQTGERIAQWGAATDLIKDNLKAAEAAGAAYFSTSEKLNILGKSYDDTKGKIEEARQLWKDSASELINMSDDERAAYEARGKAIDEWAKAEEDAYNRHSAALQKQIESEAKRGQSKRETRDEVKALISDLEHELEIIGQSATAQRISNELRRVGAKATQSQKYAITELIAEINAQKEAQEKANKAQKDFQDGIKQLESDTVDALGNVIAGTEDAADAFKKLAIEIVKSALTGKGAYADFFASLTSGSGGGLLSGLFGFGGGGTGSGLSYFPPAPSMGGIGMFAKGTDFAPGGTAIVGEKGPERVELPRGSRVTPNHRLNSGMASNGASAGGGGSFTDNRVYNFTGTSEELQQFKAFVAEQERNFDARAVNAIREAEQSNYKFGM